MFKKIKDFIVETIKEEYKFIIFLFLLLLIFNFPLNYYIVIGGGIMDASERVSVDKKKSSKGSFNISYVTQVDANVMFYAISYLIPTWERENANLYKYSEEENLEDIEFRSDLDLKTANGTAIYWAYTLAGKEVKKVSSSLYVIVVYNERYPTNLKVGDEILSVDGQELKSAEEYSSYLQTKEAGSTVKVKIKRKNKEKELDVKVYEQEGRKLLGVSLQYASEYKTNPELEIKFKKSESGPSGGLITTLEIYNQLTKKDLTKGYTIAGTGTIEEDGSIGQIGGIEHKILGAVSAKADIFLCPPETNYEQAKKYIKEKNLKIKLIKVKTIQEAIEKLEELK